MRAVTLISSSGTETSGAVQAARPVHPRSSDSALAVQFRVLQALVLRDMRTRFGRSYLGYVIAVMWPLSHLLGLLTIYTIAKRIAPIGSDLTTFIATGVLPYILCLYPARFMMLGVATNKQLLGLPLVKTTDLLFARVIVEVYTALIVMILFLIIMASFGVDIIPVDMVEAVTALAATVYFAIGFGLCSAVLYGLTRAWLVGFIGLVILMYFTSGAFVPNSALKPEYLYWMSFNPLFHSVEWLRSAYYSGYGDYLLDRTYLLGWATFLVFLALVGERMVRGIIMMKR